MIHSESRICRRDRRHETSLPRAIAWAIGCLSLLALLGATAASGATTGKVQGRILAGDSGAPIGFADVALVPVDTTQRRVGGLTNADGTFLLEAAPGRYALQIRALSYAHKRVEGIAIEAGKLLPFSTALSPEAIEIEEVVVEGKARQNNEVSMLSARRKAPSLGDAVSADQVRRSPDKDAAEVLRRVTGLSVSDGKYVFVRGLGERYSSTEIDGVRIASPEQNKRVVPLDLLPANLLENVLVQKTYTADRSGEFGGGDVQVHTKDFPGHRTWSVSLSQTNVEGSTFRDRETYAGDYHDGIGFGSGSRGIPDDVAGKVVPGWSPSTLPTLAAMARSFSNVWSPVAARTLPNANYAANYGDEFKVLGRPLGLIESWSFSRGFNQERELRRFYEGDVNALKYAYDVRRWTESAQLGGLSKLSYRLSPRHSIALNGFYTNDADNEVRIYQGPDFNSQDSNGDPLVHRNTRFQYVQRSLLSGAVEGRHQFSHLLGADLDWKFSRSKARRQQPGRREFAYDRRPPYFEGDSSHWVRGSVGRLEYGDLRDQGWGTTVSTSVPVRFGALGNGKVALGYDRQTKARDHFYRRFNIYPNNTTDREAPPDTIFAPGGFDGSLDSGWLEDATLSDLRVGIDNYRAHQRVNAGYTSTDVPFGRRLRGTFGLRVEKGYQDVQSFALFHPEVTLAEGKLENTDWLPSANLTWAATDVLNVRFAASRTISRPDLNELSPSPDLEYVGGMLKKGNPNLKRATIENYDVRVEAFPTLSEVVAAGFFYKRLEHPIEQTVFAGTPLILAPANSDRGRNLGVELEARTGLARVWSRLKGLSLNTNASFISSEVTLQQATSKTGTSHHPLQGQARYIFNGALSYSSPSQRLDASLLLGVTGKRLAALGAFVLPDIYQRPVSNLDATLNVSPFRNARVKFAAKNILDRHTLEIQNDNETSNLRVGRSYSIALSYGT